jgi:hypothetical protein
MFSPKQTIANLEVNILSYFEWRMSARKKRDGGCHYYERSGCGLKSVVAPGLASLFGNHCEKGINVIWKPDACAVESWAKRSLQRVKPYEPIRTSLVSCVAHPIRIPIFRVCSGPRVANFSLKADPLETEVETCCRNRSRDWSSKPK